MKKHRKKYTHQSLRDDAVWVFLVQWAMDGFAPHFSGLWSTCCGAWHCDERMELCR